MASNWADWPMHACAWGDWECSSAGARAGAAQVHTHGIAGMDVGRTRDCRLPGSFENEIVKGDNEPVKINYESLRLDVFRARPLQNISALRESSSSKPSSVRAL